MQSATEKIVRLMYSAGICVVMAQKELAQNFLLSSLLTRWGLQFGLLARNFCLESDTPILVSCTQSGLEPDSKRGFCPRHLPHSQPAALKNI